MSTSLTRPLGAPAINRPNVVQVGTIVWLGSEVMFFAGLFAIYFTNRSTAPDIWAEQTEKLNIPLAFTITVILVLSSVTCQFGVFAAERLQHRATGWKPTQWGMVEWFFASYILGAIFIVGQTYEYSILVSEFVSLSSDAYGSAFYITTGFHGLHVTGGLIAFLLMIGRAYSVKRFTHREAASAIVVSYYWHFVDGVWVVILSLVYLWPLFR